MSHSRLKEIVRLCREIDEAACEIYANLSDSSSDQRLADFWRGMSAEEAEHVLFWKSAERVEAFSKMPSIFDRPGEVIAELQRTLVKSQELLLGFGPDISIPMAFTIALRMEFYLLHPAFEMLFHLLGPFVDGPSPEDEYESHIRGFIDKMAEFGHATPEFELLGETLQRLWKENKKLAMQSTHDDLTGVLNRRGFFSISVQFAHLAQRAGSTIGVVMIDLDHFKSVNDRFGHPTGDLILKGVAQVMSDRLRASDLLGRYGGEEFVVMLPDTSRGGTGILAEKLRKTIQESDLEGIPLTASVGFVEGALGEDVLRDYNQLIQNADDALYQAKNAGRNRVVGYTHDLQTHQKKSKI